MDIIQALVIAILQGATELFPVSSLGHAVVLPALLHWGINQSSPEFLPFLVMLHLGTATALLGYFWQDWWAILTGLLGISGAHQAKESRRVFLLVVIATIPAVVLGFVAEKFVRGLFGSPVIAALFLIVNGLLLLFRRAAEGRRWRSEAPLDALAHGCVHHWLLAMHRVDPGHLSVRCNDRRRPVARHQSRGCSAFLLLNRDADHLGGDGIEVPKLMREHVPQGVLAMSLVAAVVAGITALLSTWHS